MSLPFLTPTDWALADALWGFSNTYLVGRYDQAKPSPDVHREWWALCLSEHPQVAIAAPRGFAKTTAITFAYVLFILLERVSKHLLLLGSNEGLAGAFVHDIKIELAENELLRKDYGIQRFFKETETELIVGHSSGKFRVLAKGAGQRMRGLKWEARRPDHVIADDLEDEEMVLNDERRDKMRRWFYGTVKPILAGRGKIRAVGTIIGFDSLLERTMPSTKSKDTVIEPLRTYSTVPQSWASVKYRAHDHDFSHLLWPAQMSAMELQRKRAEYVVMGMADIYGQEYLNDPIDPSTSYYRQQDFLPILPEHRETRKTYYAAGDLAIGEGDRNAYTVFIVGGMDADGFLNIVDVRRDRIDGEQIVDEMFSIHSRWTPDMFRLESENIEKAIGAFLFRKMDETGIYINIDSKAPTKDKDKRSQSIRARMRAGKVRFDKEAEWYPALEEELLKYPKFPYKDQHDALSWLGLMLEEMTEPQTDQEVEEEERREQIEAFAPDGRCQATGY